MITLFLIQRDEFFFFLESNCETKNGLVFLDKTFFFVVFSKSILILFIGLPDTLLPESAGSGDSGLPSLYVLKRLSASYHHNKCGFIHHMFSHVPGVYPIKCLSPVRQLMVQRSALESLVQIAFWMVTCLKLSKPLPLNVCTMHSQVYFIVLSVDSRSL